MPTLDSTNHKISNKFDKKYSNSKVFDYRQYKIVDHINKSKYFRDDEYFSSSSRSSKDKHHLSSLYSKSKQGDMIELRKVYKRSESKLPRSYQLSSDRRVVKRRSRSREVHILDNYKKDEIVSNNIIIPRPENTVKLKWEQELYGPDKAKLKLLDSKMRLSPNVKRPINKLLTSPAKKLCNDSRNSMKVLDNVVNPYVKSKEPIKNLEQKSIDLEHDIIAPIDAITVDDQNYLEKMPIINKNEVKMAQTSNVAEAINVPFVIFDYQHEDFKIDNDFVNNLISDNEIKFDNTQLISCHQNLPNDNGIPSTGVNDIKALADLIVSPSCTENVVKVETENIQENECTWRIHRLTIDNQLYLTHKKIDYSRCHKNDPRISHLRKQ